MKNTVLTFTELVNPAWDAGGIVRSDNADNYVRSAKNLGEETADVSPHEISELVSGALNDALLAAAQDSPDAYLDILELRKRNSIAARLHDLPKLQLGHPVVHAEVLNELAMTRVQSKLASRILESIHDYAGSKRRAWVDAMT